MSSNCAIITGCVIEKSGKFLLVQEALKSCRGKWNLPAGHLDPGETITEAAKREANEETGCSVELTGICQIGNCIAPSTIFVSVIFSAKLVHETIKFNHDEILAVKWFSYEEIIAMRNKLRNETLILGAIDNFRKNLVAPLKLIDTL